MNLYDLFESGHSLDENLSSVTRRATNYFRNIGQSPNPTATLYTNPNYKGSKVSNKQVGQYPTTNIPVSALKAWEPDSKMDYPGNRANVMQMVSAIQQGQQLPPITVVNKGGSYLIIDGHHRYTAYKLAGAKTIPARVIDAKDVRYSDEVLHESANPRDLKNVGNTFIKFCKKTLDINQLPKIRLVKQIGQSEHPTFGLFDPNTNTIQVATGDRHIMDIMRTLAHELTHHKQREDNRIKPGDGDTGSDIENEANAQAGVLMRDFADQNPGLF